MTDLSESGLHRALKEIREDGDDMHVPRSTLVVGAAFWAVLVAMQGWVISRQESTAAAAAELRGDVKEIKAQFGALKENVGDVKESQTSMDRRLSNMEQRQIQATR